MGVTLRDIRVTATWTSKSGKLPGEMSAVFHVDANSHDDAKDLVAALAQEVLSDKMRAKMDGPKLKVQF
jgi:hypothetical protein